MLMGPETKLNFKTLSKRLWKHSQVYEVTNLGREKPGEDLYRIAKTSGYIKPGS